MAALKARGLSRQALIKEDAKGIIPESKITSQWANVADTNLGKFVMKKFQGPLYTNTPTRISKKMIKSGVIQAAGFPLAIQCNELIVECARHYDTNTKQIKTSDGKVLAFLSETAIHEAFNIPEPKDIIYKSKEAALVMYEDDPVLTCISYTIIHRIKYQ